MNDVILTADVRQLLSTALHHLDTDNKTCSAADIPVESTDLQGYLDELLTEISIKPQNRAYELVSTSTEFATSLNAFHVERLLGKDPAEALAQRLLRTEVSTDARYGHFAAGGSGHVKRGSFLQFLYQDSGVVTYLGVKVEHQSILDETDFKRRIGLGESQKIYKACKVSFDSTGKPQHTLVFDTNSKPSVYWWKDVWELSPLRSDETNTEQAASHIVRVLQKIRKTAPADHTILRNAVVAAFKQEGAMDFDSFITATFSSYQPVTPAFAAQLPKLVEELRALPAKKNFDTHFTLAPAAVPYKQVKVQLNNDVSLSYDEGMQNLDDKIWASSTTDGKQVIVIDAPEAANRFRYKPWNN